MPPAVACRVTPQCYAQEGSKQRRIVKIRGRLLWLVFLAWLPSALAISIVARSAYVDQRTASLEEVQRVVENLANTVERELDKRFVMATTLSSSASLEYGDLARFYEEASRATRGTESWAVVLTPTHQVLNTLRPYDARFSLPRDAGGPWVLAGDHIYFSRSGPLSKRPVLGVVAAQSSSPVQYHVAITFGTSVFQALVSKQVCTHNAVVSVMDKNVRVIARSRDPEKWLGHEATGPLRARALAGKSGFEPSVTLDGVPSLTYLSKPNRYGWYAVAAVPVAALNAQAIKSAIDVVSVAATLLGLSLLGALYVARSIGTPILALKDAADALVEKRIPIATKTGLFEADEVSKALHDAGRHARDTAQVLEAKVAEAVSKAAAVQAELAETQKREAVGRLAGGIAHDFNNLLQTISTALHLVTVNSPEGSQRRLLDAASRACGKATGLVKQMLAFGRAQTLQPVPVDLSDFLLRVSELALKAAGANVSLKARIEAHTPAVLVDPTQFELALLNVIFNARDAMKSSGNIELCARLVDASQTGLAQPSQTQYVQIDIRDDGPGMGEDVREKAFDPYFTTKAVGAGSGLGLAQVLSFVRQSGGNARITSSVGAGTTIHMFLPTTSELPPEEPLETIAALDATRSLRILMVEDDPLVASVVAPALEAAGHTVAHCVTADDAKEALRENWQFFDAVFTDVVMPGAMTGYDLAQWCRDELPQLPVLLATGYSAEAPRSDFPTLRKPYPLDELLEALQQLKR